VPAGTVYFVSAILAALALANAVSVLRRRPVA
jgi:hypothetical protein